MIPAALTPPALAALDGLTYTGAPLDRGEPVRADPAALARLRADPQTRLVPIWRNSVLADTRGGRSAPRAALLAPGDLPETPAMTPQEEAFLGLDADGVAWFGLQLPPDSGAGGAADQTPQGPDPGPGAPPGARFLPLRTVGPALPAAEAAILAQALGVLAWHRRHRFCAACGAPSRPDQGGWRRRCTETERCGALHFPRTDPAVIMLVHHGRGAAARCLLGRGPRLPPRMLSTLAGFVEPGESLEEAVRREIAEETGVRVGRVAYAGSQPWPFPSSIMLGFHCEAETADIVLDPRELEHAGWYARTEVAAFAEMPGDPRTALPGDGWLLPRADSIARRLILGWLSDDPFA